MLDDEPAVRADVLAIQSQLVAVTERNLHSIPASLQPTRRMRQDDSDE